MCLLRSECAALSKQPLRDDPPDLSPSLRSVTVGPRTQLLLSAHRPQCGSGRRRDCSCVKGATIPPPASTILVPAVGQKEPSD